MFGPAACSVDGEEDGPGDAGPDEHDDYGHAQEAEEEVCVKGLVLEGVGVGDGEEGTEPVEPSCWEGGGAVSSEVLVGTKGEEGGRTFRGGIPSRFWGRSIFYLSDGE